MKIDDYIAQQHKRVEAALDRWVPAESQDPPTIHRAMRYSLFAGGKRIRPILCIEAARAVSDSTGGAVTAACSLELFERGMSLSDCLPQTIGRS